MGGWINWRQTRIDYNNINSTSQPASQPANKPACLHADDEALWYKTDPCVNAAVAVAGARRAPNAAADAADAADAAWKVVGNTNNHQHHLRLLLILLLLLLLLLPVQTHFHFFVWAIAVTEIEEVTAVVTSISNRIIDRQHTVVQPFSLTRWRGLQRFRFNEASCRPAIFFARRQRWRLLQWW